MNRSFLIGSILVCSLGATAQTTTPAAPAPRAQVSPAPGQTAAAAHPDIDAIAAKEPNKVVATVNGKQLTAKEVVDMMKLIPEDRRKSVPLQTAIQQLYMVSDLSKKATADHLDQQSPWKEQIESDRERILAQAYLQDAVKKSSAPVGDAKAYYDSHSGEFDRATVSGIVVAFNAPGTPAGQNNGITRSDDQAKQKANDIVAKLKGGADFAQTAKTESDEQQSAARGGQMGTLAAASPNIPQDIKDTIFNKLQPGQVSDPVKGPNAYYIFKLDSREKQSFDQAKPEIEQQLKSEHDRGEAQKITEQYKVQVVDPAFFGTSAAPSLQNPKPTGK